MGTGWHASTWHAAPHARREGIAEWLHLRARASRSLIVLLLAWCALGSVAQAHQTKLSSSRLVVEGTRITARIEMNGGDLESGASTTLAGASTEVLPERLVSERAAIHRYLRAHVRLASSGGFACEWSRLGLAPKGEHVVADAQWRCPAVERALVYRVTLFHEVDPGARHMVTVDGPKKFVALLDGSHPELTLSAAGPSLPATLLRYLFAGIEHILIGYDHIAFLLAVIVVDRRVWSLFKAVSAFTVAHSITLFLSPFSVNALKSCPKNPGM